MQVCGASGSHFAQLTSDQVTHSDESQLRIFLSVSSSDPLSFDHKAEQKPECAWAYAKTHMKS